MGASKVPTRCGNEAVKTGPLIVGNPKPCKKKLHDPSNFQDFFT